MRGLKKKKKLGNSFIYRVQAKEYNNFVKLEKSEKLFWKSELNHIYTNENISNTIVILTNQKIDIVIIFNLIRWEQNLNCRFEWLSNILCRAYCVHVSLVEFQIYV